MSITSLVQDLRPILSTNALILDDRDSEDFKAALIRWSDVDLQVPAAIVKPATEDDIVVTVKYAVDNAIPFVPKAGGHSLWSTIGGEGFILDLSLYTGTHVDTVKQTVTMKGGTLAQEVYDTVYHAGFCFTGPNSSTVGMIPFTLGGGMSAIPGIHGYAVDNIVAVRIVTPSQGLAVASESENPDLFWAVKGAGQFFGVVTEMTLKVHPLSTLGREDGKLWTWKFFFSPKQVDDVDKVVSYIANNTTRPTSGAALILAPPPKFDPMIMVSTFFCGSEEDARRAFAVLFDLGPLHSEGTLVPFNEIPKAFEVFNKKGGYKQFISTGLQRFDTEGLKRSLGIWLELAEECPRAKGTAFLLSWFNNQKVREVAEDSTAFGHRDIGAWQMAILNTPDAETFNVAATYSEKFLSMWEEGQQEEEKASFLNHNRTAPLDRRYKGEARQRKLKTLKKTWDPNGVFTTQLL